MTPVRPDRTSWAATARPPRIVHVGVGSFSRAHQAWYAAHADPAGEWGIVAFTGRNPAVAEVLSRQEGLYTLIERGPREEYAEGASRTSGGFARYETGGECPVSMPS